MSNESSQKKSTIWTRNFICVFIIFAMLQFSHTAVNTLVSTYAVHLGAGPVIMGMLTGMLFAVALVMRPFIGPITAKFNHRLLMILASILGVISYIGYALFHEINIFVAFRIIAGFQYAVIGTLGMTLAADSVPEEKLASGISMYAIGGAILAVFGPSLGILCRDLGTSLRGVDFGYTLVFLVGMAAMIISTIASFCLDNRALSEGPKMDLGKWYKNIVDINALPAAGLGALTVIGYSIINSYMVPFTVERDIAGVSTFFMLMGISMFAVKPISGRMIEKYGLFKFIIVATLVYVVSFIFIGTARTTWAIFVGAVCAALGYGSALPAFQTMAIQAVYPQKRAVASNTMYLGLDIGNFCGPLLGGVVYGFSTYGTVMLSALVPVTLALIFFFVIWPTFARRRDKVAEEVTSMK